MGNYASKNSIEWLINAIKNRFAKKEELDAINELLADKASMHGVLTEGDGNAYTAIVDGIDSLEVGVYFMMIPHVISTSTSPTLNVNGLGAKSLRCRISGTTSATVVATDANWLAKNKPVMVTYDGLFWIVDHIRPNANNLYGVVQIEQGGTGAETAEVACENLGAFPVTGGTVTGATTFESTVTVGDATLEYDAAEEALVITFE